jgi:hypothetical protein
MALVHVRLDVDSDVHPELYAMLASIDRAASRSERVRQLASSGLIWEHLRVQGPVQLRGAVQVDIEVGEVGNDPVAERSRVAPPPVPVAPVAAAALPAAAKVEPTGGATKRAAPSRSSPPRDLPVLYDAVDVDEVEARNSAGVGMKAGPANAAAHQANEGAPDSSAPAPARKTGPRPRLMRMKEKGLFKNG